jgi:hypothetical protein
MTGISLSEQGLEPPFLNALPAAFLTQQIAETLTDKDDPTP